MRPSMVLSIESSFSFPFGLDEPLTLLKLARKMVGWYVFPSPLARASVGVAIMSGKSHSLTDRSISLVDLSVT